MRQILLSSTAVVAVAASLGLARANAAQIDNTYHDSITAGDWFAERLDINTFDTNLGTLTSVVVVQNLTTSFHGVASLTTGGVMSATIPMHSRLYITGGPTVLDGAPVLSVDVSDPFVLTTAESAVSDSGTTGGIPANYTGALSEWESSGPGTTSIFLETRTSADAPPGVNFEFAPDQSYQIQVTYNYDPVRSVPEPATLGLLGAGMAGLGMRRWRRRT